MNEFYYTKVYEWIFNINEDNKAKENFKEFFDWIKEIKHKNKRVKILWKEKEYIDVIKEFNITFNNKFKDFIFEIQLAENNFSIYRHYVTFHNFIKLDEKKYKITDCRNKKEILIISEV